MRFVITPESLSLMTPGVLGILPRRCARPVVSGILGAEEPSDIPDRKVAGAGEEQLVLLNNS